MASNKTSCSLVTYVENVLFQDYVKNRQEIFEIIWDECRSSFLRLRSTKFKRGESEGWRDKTYSGIARQKAVAAFALLVDQVLQDGNFPYVLQPNTWMQSILAKSTEAEAETAKKAIDEFKSLIDMQLRDCNADAQLRNIIYSIAIYGIGFAKKITKNKVTRYYRPPAPAPVVEGALPPEQPPVGNVFELVVNEKIQPGIESVNVWNMFWDIENPIGKGAGEIERQMVSPDWLYDQIGKDFFLTEKIKEVVTKKMSAKNPVAPSSDGVPSNINPALRSIPSRFNNIDYKECYVRVPVEYVEEFERDYAEELGIPASPEPVRSEPGSSEKVEVMVCIADGVPVRFSRITPDLRPYFSVVWQNDIGEIAPYGVVESCLDVEKLMNGAVRGMADNKKLSGNVIFGVKVDAIENIEEIKRDGLQPGTMIQLGMQAKTVSDALQQFTVQDVGDSYGPLIELATRMADEESMIPKVSQGLAMQSKQTAYEVSQLVEKSGKYIGSVIKNIDEFIEAVVLYMYDYNMMDPSIDIQKGDYTVSAEGFTFFQDRVVRVQKMKEFLSMIMQHEALMAGWKVDEIMTQIAKGLDLDPDLIEKTEADKAKEAAIAAQKPPDPMLEAELKVKDAKAQKDAADAQKTAVETDLLERDMRVKEALAVKSMEDDGGEKEGPEAGLAESELKAATDAEKNAIAAEKNMIAAKKLDDDVYKQERQHEHEKMMKAAELEQKNAEAKDREASAKPGEAD